MHVKLAGFIVSVANRLPTSKDQVAVQSSQPKTAAAAHHSMIGSDNGSVQVGMSFDGSSKLQYRSIHTDDVPKKTPRFGQFAKTK